MKMAEKEFLEYLNSCINSGMPRTDLKTLIKTRIIVLAGTAIADELLKQREQ